MEEKHIRIFERALLIGAGIGVSLLLCYMFNLSSFYACIAALNVANLSDSKTKRQAYERTITTFCGGAVACMIAYSGFQENMFLYVIGLIIVCFLTEMIVKVPATVGCIAFTYIMLNIDPNRSPSQYLEERVLGTALGAFIIALIVTLYNKYRHKDKEILGSYPKKEWHHHLKRALIPGIAVVLGVIIINYLNKFLDSKYVTRYTMYYCALASVVPFHIDLKELFHKTKERFLSTVLGGIVASFFIVFNFNGIFWCSVGIFLLIIIIESLFDISASLGGIVFLFLMLNINESLMPSVYYVDRVLGTGIGIILILILVYIFNKLKYAYKNITRHNSK